MEIKCDTSSLNHDFSLSSNSHPAMSMNQKSLEDLPFGMWLHQRRRILDLTQQELADQVGCARITWRRMYSLTWHIPFFIHQ
jgi:hypothetical protein